jgi:hypothetical protein
MQLLAVDREDTAEKSERKIRIDDTVVKVRTLPPSKVRPEYTVANNVVCRFLVNQT